MNLKQILPKISQGYIIQLNPSSILFLLIPPVKNPKMESESKKPIIQPLSEAEIALFSAEFRNFKIPKDKMILSTEGLKKNHAKWNIESSIIVKVLHGENLRQSDVMRSMKAVWRVSKVEISVKGENRFACRFERVQDKIRIDDSQPWMIDSRHLLLQKPYSAEMDVKSIVFDSFPVWIRFLNLHTDHLSEENIRDIASGVGEVLVEEPVGIPPKNADGYRAKVNFSIENPLKNSMMVNTLVNGWVCVEFIYVNLPSCFCNRCEMIGRDRFNCPCPARIEHVQRGDVSLSQPIMLLETGQGIVSSVEKGESSEAGQITVAPVQKVTDRIMDVNPSENHTTNPPPATQVGQSSKYLPHHFFEGKKNGDEPVSLTQEAEQPVPKKGRGRPRGKAIKKESIKDIDVVSDSPSKKRKGLFIEPQPNSQQTSHPSPAYSPYISTYVPLTSSSAPNERQTPTLSEIWGFLLSPEVAPQLAAQGIINPEIFGIFANASATHFSQTNERGSFDELNTLGQQIHANQLDFLGQDSGILSLSETQENLEIAMSENMVTIDHLGGMEARNEMGDVFLQAENNLMQNAPFEPTNNQVPPGASPPLTS